MLEKVQIWLVASSRLDRHPLDEQHQGRRRADG
jgi:hypothetical protein